MARSYSIGTLQESYGRGSHTIEDVELVQPDEILRALRQRFASPQYRPPLLPAVAVQVHGLTRRSDASIGDVITLIERDPLLAADVMRRAQSPVYSGRAAPPRSLAQAGLRLGLKGLGDLVLQVALTSRVFRVKGLDGPMTALSRHCVAGHRRDRRGGRRAARVLMAEVRRLTSLRSKARRMAGQSTFQVNGSLP